MGNVGIYLWAENTQAVKGSSNTPPYPFPTYASMQLLLRGQCGKSPIMYDFRLAF